MTEYIVFFVTVHNLIHHNSSLDLKLIMPVKFVFAMGATEYFNKIQKKSNSEFVFGVTVLLYFNLYCS